MKSEQERVRKDTVLFGIFVKRNQLKEALAFVDENFEVPSNHAFLYKVKNNMLLTFTAKRGVMTESIKESEFKIITLQRNREFNTFFTINAINYIVKAETGRIDEQHRLDFSEYRDNLLYTRGERIHRSKIFFQKRLLVNRERTETYNYEQDLMNE